MGQTPLDPDEAAGLIPPDVFTMGDLNTCEQKNILQARRWVMLPRNLKSVDVFSETFVRDLHKRMFGDVWKWAGAYRTTQKNIGIEAYRIQTELRQILNDAQYWQTQKIYAAGEQAVRLHHRVVQVHLFANGNGRHARMLADVLVAKEGAPPLGWGMGRYKSPAAMRQAYIASLRTADAGDYAPLLNFAT